MCVWRKGLSPVHLLPRFYLWDVNLSSNWCRLTTFFYFSLKDDKEQGKIYLSTEWSSIKMCEAIVGWLFMRILQILSNKLHRQNWTRGAAKNIKLKTSHFQWKNLRHPTSSSYIFCVVYLVYSICSIVYCICSDISPQMQYSIIQMQYTKK